MAGYAPYPIMPYLFTAKQFRGFCTIVMLTKPIAYTMCTTVSILISFYSLHIHVQAFYFPIDPGVNFYVANKLIRELQPKRLVTPVEYLPSSAQAQKETTCLQPVRETDGTICNRGLVIFFHN